MTGFWLRPPRLRPPRLRPAEAPDQERHATWFELFFDLVFVAAAAQLTRGLRADMSGHGLLVFAGLLVPVWGTGCCTPPTPTGSIPTTCRFGR